MNGFEGLKCTEEYLDTIDIKQEASEFGRSDLGDFMDFLEDKYGKTLVDNPVFCGFVFNWMNTEEFLDYLNKRYAEFYFREISTYYFHF